MFEKKSSFGKFAFAFVMGAAAGAAVALLYAPMTGRRMQKKVAGMTDKIVDVVEDGVENVQKFARKVANA